MPSHEDSKTIVVFSLCSFFAFLVKSRAELDPIWLMLYISSHSRIHIVFVLSREEPYTDEKERGRVRGEKRERDCEISKDAQRYMTSPKL